MPHPSHAPNTQWELWYLHRSAPPTNEHRATHVGADISISVLAEQASEMRKNIAKELKRVKREEGVDLEQVSWANLKPKRRSNKKRS
jgi:hypothetical protein